jgi:hypothetical protein
VIILSACIGGPNQDLLPLFDGASPDLGIVSIATMGNSAGRVLTLRTGAKVVQDRLGGKWECRSFVGVVPDAIVDAYFEDGSK